MGVIARTRRALITMLMEKFTAGFPPIGALSSSDRRQERDESPVRNTDAFKDLIEVSHLQQMPPKSQWPTTKPRRSHSGVWVRTMRSYIDDGHANYKVERIMSSCRRKQQCQCGCGEPIKETDCIVKVHVDGGPTAGTYVLRDLLDPQCLRERDPGSLPLRVRNLEAPLSPGRDGGGAHVPRVRRQAR